MKKLISLSVFVLISAPSFAGFWSCTAACTKGPGWDYDYVSAEADSAAEAFKKLQVKCPGVNGASRLAKMNSVIKVSDGNNNTLLPAWAPVSLSDACVRN